jgi:cobalt-zinc-cadmium efflux system membrane fusion protein
MTTRTRSRLSRPTRTRAAGWRAVAATTALAAVACAAPPPEAGTQPASNADRPSLFTVPASQLPNLQVVAVQKASWPVVVRTSGTVDWDADHTAQAITQVSGPITRLLVDTGTRVAAGEPLLYVSSPEVAAAVAAYREARNRLDLARRTLERDRDLFAHKAIAQKDLDESESSYHDAVTEEQNTLDALRIYGVAAEDLAAAESQDAPVKPELAVRAPIAGTVVEKLVLPGQVIQAGSTVCFVISNVSTVWVQGHVYDSDLPAVRVGDRVDVGSSALPERYQGVVAYIGAALDPGTRTTPVRIVTRNPDGLLKKELFVDVTIHTAIAHEAVVAPASAVLYNAENFPFVYLQVQPGQFAERLVKTGAHEDDKFQILDGLEPGDRIVSEGSVFLQFAQAYQK